MVKRPKLLVWRSLALCAVLATTAEAQTHFPDIDPKEPIQDCGSPKANPDICRVRQAVRPEDAASHLGKDHMALWREGNRLLLVSCSAAPQAGVAGALFAPLAKIDGTADLWSLVLDIPRLDEANLDVFPTPPAPGPFRAVLYRGPKAPPAAVTQADLQGQVLQDEIDSQALGAKRKLTIYLPPKFDPRKRYPVVYVADGASVSYYAHVTEPAILDKRLPPLVLVGLHAGGGERRNRDYVLGWSDTSVPFVAHERFLIEEVMPRAESLWGAATKREQRLITGKSAGGSWALDTALRHPDLFAQAAPAAIASVSAEGVERPGRPRLWIVTGLFDPFLPRSRSIAERAAKSGDEIVLKTPVSGHGATFYQDQWVEMLAWAFGRP
ncbi:alpha/beta hydrolase [Caulobacter sp.]|uniref:alpha/beta hydrolase n=1 Tax=Caulobacter sp. TaxID=78 RepID=UPI002B48140D|nr:alpha/beta hydrolase-fold protein [Caulobacter sp.]HJV41998.1 alpha/beta hydrolase-fold protein [Caulobacter sp.]